MQKLELKWAAERCAPAGTTLQTLIVAQVLLASAPWVSGGGHHDLTLMCKHTAHSRQPAFYANAVQTCCDCAQNRQVPCMLQSCYQTPSDTSIHPSPPFQQDSVWHPVYNCAKAPVYAWCTSIQHQVPTIPWWPGATRIPSIGCVRAVWRMYHAVPCVLACSL
jgi:hypothetical protein